MIRSRLATWDAWRTAAFTRRDELTWPVKLGLALLMAGLTGLAAQVRVPLPFTPVPVTGQVFAVLLCGALLGGLWGGVSQTFYVGLGALGVPWFAGMAGGMPLGPTAGYLLGFIVAASLIGIFTDRFAVLRSFLPQVALMVVGVAVIYTLGALVFSLTMRTSLSATLAMSVLPFIWLDLFKAVAAAGVAAALLPPARDEEE